MSKQPDDRDDLIEDLYRSLMIMKGLYEGAIWQSSYLLRHRDELPSDTSNDEFMAPFLVEVVSFNENDCAGIRDVARKYRAYKASRDADEGSAS